MLKKLYQIPATLLVIVLLIINLILCPVMIFIFALIRLITPIPKLRLVFFRWMNVIPVIWGTINGWILQITTFGKWDLPDRTELSPELWYLIICNHRSWFDIIVLNYAFCWRTPPFKFFMKHELLWGLPFGGLACWILGFPFVRRHSRQEIRKNPALKGRDIETARQSCQKFKTIPCSVINFVEGTRITPAKHKKQKSPLKNLLKPSAGGIAITLSEMFDTLDSVLNVTIHYDAKKITLWSFLCGDINRITVRYERVPLTPVLKGDYYTDRAFRMNLQNWLNNLWEEKDKELDKIIKNSQS